MIGLGIYTWAGQVLYFLVASISGRLKTRDWSLENAGQSYSGVENARLVAMERQSYKCSKT